MATQRTALVTGASGYIGGRLVPELLKAGWAVRAMARDARRLRDYSWASEVRVVEADVSKPETLAAAMDGVDCAYYLVHSIGGSAKFEDADREAAQNFATVAQQQQVGRIVYLGGLAPPDEVLSPHLRSREEVGQILLASGVPTAVLRAAVVIGSGSASFEMLRYLAERLPAMIAPKWIESRIQPIAVRDVLRYLVGAGDLSPDVNRAFDVGGPEVLTYRDMMQGYARVAGLRKRRILTVPVLTPRLSSHWVGVVTPVPGGLARPLVESLRHEVVCREEDIKAYVPDPPEGLLGFDKAVQLALTRIRDADVATHWSNATVRGAAGDPMPTDPSWAGGDLFVDDRSCLVNGSPDALWSVIESIGGESGWYSWSLAWRVRGLLDRLAGGPGLRRGRRSRYDLQLGDAVDFWRVEEIIDKELLRLRAEMRVPGLAWLDLGIEIDEHGRTRFRQRAVFAPRGLLGRAYWWAVWPFHGQVFGGMQRNIAARAEATAASNEAAAWRPSGNSG